MPAKKIKKLRKELSSQVKQKGHERLTIMVIPHEGQKIFSLQVNWWLISFICGSVIILVFLAVFEFYNKYNNAHEKAELSKRYGNNLQSAIKLDQLARNTAMEYKTLLYHLSKTFQIIGTRNRELQLLSNEEQAKERTFKILHRQAKMGEKKLDPRSDFLPPTYTIQAFHEYMENQLPLLETLHFLTTQSLYVYNRIPIGRPFEKEVFSKLRDTSGFGNRINPINNKGLEFHGGYDMAGPSGIFVRATADGIVHKNYYDSNGYGRMIIIKHDFGFYSAYAHLLRSLVKSGSVVRKGEIIGTMGNSGRTTGSHLHYEVRLRVNNRVDPKPFICAGDFNSNSCLRYHKRK